MNNRINYVTDKIWNMIFFIIIITLILILAYYFVNRTNLIIPKPQIKEYAIQQTPKGFQSNGMKFCTKGCSRGTCKKNDVPDGCRHDFECSYCTDRRTRQFYVDLTNYEKLTPTLDEQDKISNTQSETLNDHIEKNNDYIDELNNKIQDYNMH